MGSKHTTRAQDYSKWYNELVQRADLAEHSDVRGCMIIKPYGFAIWERMKEVMAGQPGGTGNYDRLIELFYDLDAAK